MSLNNILLSVVGMSLVGSLVTNYLLTNKLEKTKSELAICEISGQNLNKSLELQNKEIEKLKSETKNIEKEKDLISKKYNIIIENEKNFSNRVQNLTLKGVKEEDAICRVNLDLIEEALNEFFKQSK